MDKIATNNFLVDLRDDVKAAKAMVAGNFVRKIKELKKALEKDSDPSQKDKTEKKIEALHNDIRLLKSLNPYQVGKSALLKPDPKYWNDLVGDSKALEEAKVMARVVAKNRIQKRVTQFRTDHKDCDEWLEEYFDYREKKRELTEAKISRAKAKKDMRNGSHGFTKKNAPPNKGPRSNKINTNSAAAKKFTNRNYIESRQGNSLKGPKTSHKDQNNRRTNDKTSAQAKQEPLHPSWASKRKQKEILKAALSGKSQTHPKRIILNSA